MDCISSSRLTVLAEYGNRVLLVLDIGSDLMFIFSFLVKNLARSSYTNMSLAESLLLSHVHWMN